MTAFWTVTEAGGSRGSRAQLERAGHRYHLAGTHAGGRDVLEVACGVGQGLGYLARSARRVVGLDIDEKNVDAARRTYRDRAAIEIVQGDAAALPFGDASFDVVILFEAIYYLPDVDAFLREASRVLRSDGVLLICEANPEVPGFHESPFSKRYFSAADLAAMLGARGFSVEIFGEGRIARDGLRVRAMARLKQFAVRFHLIPQTLRGRAILKRILFGRLVELPHELSQEQVQEPALERLDENKPCTDFEVLHCVARRTGRSPS